MIYTAKELLKLWKLAEWKYITESGLVCEGPCFLLDVSVKITPTAGSAYLCDGLNEDAEQFLNIGGAASAFEKKTYQWPLYLKKGIYAILSAYVGNLSVHFVREDMLK